MENSLARCLEGKMSDFKNMSTYPVNNRGLKNQARDCVTSDLQNQSESSLSAWRR